MKRQEKTLIFIIF